MIDEVWKVVPSFPQIEASSLGRIRRRIITRPMPNGGTRTYCGLPTFGCKAASTGLAGFRMIYRYKSLRKTFKVSRLVCEAFHGPPPFPSAVAMHGDDDPANNRPNNLQWGTQKENLNAEQFISYCKSRTGANNPRAKARMA